MTEKRVARESKKKPDTVMSHRPREKSFEEESSVLIAVIIYL